jgi:L-asparaginase
MKNILLLATGGTIASVEGKDGLAPGLAAEDLMKHFFQDSTLDVTIKSKTILNIDSTNMQPEHWVQIAEEISSHYEQYDGFVITHGTDTLAYTSAALSYMLQHLKKPVVITGSQVPISVRKTDARKNLRDAIVFACEDVGGVFVVFNGRVIVGTRAMKLRTKSYDAFASINHPYVAYMEQDRIEYQWKPEKSSALFQTDTSLNPSVFLLKLHPGLDPAIFDFIKKQYKGVIIESFGNGGLPFQGRNVLPKIEELIKAGLVVVITTQCLEEGENIQLYEVGRKVAKYRIVLSGDMNTEAITAKLMWTLGKTNELDEIKKIIETPIAGDITPKK